jgi:hypothetical protein
MDTSGGYLARTNIPYTPYHRNNAWYEDGRAACRGVIGSWHIILNNNFCINIRYNEHLALAAYIMNIMVLCEKTNFSSSSGNPVLSYSIGKYMVSSICRIYNITASRGILRPLVDTCAQYQHNLLE